MVFARTSDARVFSTVHAALLPPASALFLGGLIADVAYVRTSQIQWANFAAWLIAGAMVFAGLALAWSLLQLIQTSFRERTTLLTSLLLLGAFVLGLMNCFIHARDAFGSMPAGLLLSIVVTLLALVATGLGLYLPRSGAVR